MQVLAGGAQKQVVVSYSGCKPVSTDTISWACCRSTGCTLDSCAGTKNGTKCDTISQVANALTFTVGVDTTSITVQTHDGNLGGDSQYAGCTPGSTTASGATCCGGGGNGNSCGNEDAAGNQWYTSNTCDFAVDLSGCTVLPPEEDAPVSVSQPEPECTTNEQCAAATFDHLRGACVTSVTCDLSVNKCVSNYNAGFKCRTAAGNTCQTDGFCVAGNVDCPTDTYQPQGTVCRAASKACDVSNGSCVVPTAPPPPELASPQHWRRPILPTRPTHPPHSQLTLCPAAG